MSLTQPHVNSGSEATDTKKWSSNVCYKGDDLALTPIISPGVKFFILFIIFIYLKSHADGVTIRKSCMCICNFAFLVLFEIIFSRIYVHFLVIND